MSKVRLRDLIWISQDYTTFRKCLVVIDRERGLTRPVGISLKQRGKALADIWVNGVGHSWSRGTERPGPGHRNFHSGCAHNWAAHYL